MKKNILFVLLSVSLLFETVLANAVSIEFEDLEQSHINEENSIDIDSLLILLCAIRGD